jgi:hypothetical protein
MYLATEYWRGALNIKHMRLLSTEKEAVDYARTLNSISSFTRVYELFLDKPPRLVRDR